MCANSKCKNKVEIKCRACGLALSEATRGKVHCEETNTYEHDFPGYRLVTTLTPVK